ncbi:MAG TPA: endonuclease/exonuclease/phosphatase family protein [Patescibacteria group bacterium]|nr:endonuclease/exonuclease/phosphatase family protein [Patescibacteria group bacterium]
MTKRQISRAAGVIAAALVLIYCKACTPSEDGRPDAKGRQSTDPVQVLESDPNSVKVGTFNIAWLGDGIRDRTDRTDEDYRRIADVIAQANPDILGLQEIENGAAVERVLQFLPGYKYVIGKGGAAQNVGFLFKKEISVTPIGEYGPVSVRPRRTRPGYVVQCRKGNFDWLMMSVHFKSTSRYDSTAEMRREARQLRFEQARAVSLWADSLLKNGKEHDLIIVGDMNDFPRRKTNASLTPILSNENLEFLTYDTRSCWKGALYAIDQIVVSKSAKTRFKTGSEQLYNFNSSLKKAEAQKVSDHCPVMVQLDVTVKDND